MTYPTAIQRTLNLPFLGKCLFFLIKLKQSVRQKKLSKRRQDIAKLNEIFACDPVIDVEEFLGNFFIDPRSDIFTRLALNREYEPEHAKLCGQYIDINRDAVDVGANIGFYTVFMAKRLKGRMVLSIEPAPNAHRRLQKNLTLNGVEEMVAVFHGVASDTEGKIGLNTIEGKEEFSSLGKMKHPSIREESNTIVQTYSRTLDSLVEENNLNPGFLKVDVEGTENLVFKGAQGIIQEFRPIILSEISNYLLQHNGSSSREVIESIRKHDYRVFDPFNPDLRPGKLDFGDILCIPKELE